MRGECNGSGRSTPAGWVPRNAIAPGTRCSMTEKSSDAMIGAARSITRAGPNSSLAIARTRAASCGSFTVTGTAARSPRSDLDARARAVRAATPFATRSIPASTNRARAFRTRCARRPSSTAKVGDHVRSPCRLESSRRSARPGSNAGTPRRHPRLQRDHDLAGDRQRIDRLVRCRSVPAAPAHGDAKAVHRRHQRARRASRRCPRAR